ncbi:MULTISPECIES: hypothetical protein [Rhodococcus]|uniref:AMIN-like domain-containing protein n=1 Tax=Rhodococcus parequi TaxID=3137122 RepID=A0ABW9FGD4_9NOCA
MTYLRSRRTLAISSVALAAIALAGCSSTDSEPTASSTSITASTSSPVKAAPLAADEGTLTAAPTAQDAQTGTASADAALTISDMRIGTHDGFDRVVFEFGGTGTPGWRSEIVSTANQQGSGKPLAVSGQAILQVMITGASMPYATGVEEYAGPNPLEAAPGGIVTEVRDAGIFEGTDQTLIGLARPDADYRVYTLDNPTRLVVDVAR